MNVMKTTAMSLLLSCALLLPACAQNQRDATAAAEDMAAQESPLAEEPEFSEGTDTPCSVSYSPYEGEFGELFLAKGDQVAVIAPSATPSKEQVDATMAGLKGWGYIPVAGSHVYDEKTTLDNCLEDLTWALEDPSIRAIFCVRGGYGASEVQDALPLDLISSAKKLIIGYSDITIYHSAWTRAQLPSVQASMSAAFMGLSEPCVEAEQRILRGEIPSYTCASSDLCHEGEAEGILIGGNLSTFTAVLGTAYDCTQTDEPYILFFEDVAEDEQHIHRYLTILKHLGVLDRAEGIVFGEWTEVPTAAPDYDGSSRGGKFASVADMIDRQILTDVDAPVAFGFPAGHGKANYPLLMGATARLCVTSDSFTLSWV